MATSSEQGIVLHRLGLIFNNFDKDVVEIVARECNFNLNDACRVLSDMAGQTNAISTPNTGISLPETCRTIIDFIRKGYQIMVFMRGLPGSGKSTLAAMIVERGLGIVNRDEFILSADDYFCKTGAYVYNSSEVSSAHLWNQRRCFSSVTRGVSPIIIDNTNLEVWEMQIYATMAVEYGYMIEIIEPATPWALNPKVLERRNSHSVDKHKITQMMKRFERNLTVPYLLSTLKLSYKVKLPQFRQYPPFEAPLAPSPPPASSNGAVKKRPMVEYVHKFQHKEQGSSSKKAGNGDDIDSYRSNKTGKPDNTNSYRSNKTGKQDIDSLLDIGEENKDKTEDLISFINENKPEPVSTDVISKQLEENNEMMAKLMVVLSQNCEKVQPSLQSKNVTSSDVENKMEVDQSVDTGVGATALEFGLRNGNRSLKLLEEENKKLKDLLDKAAASEKNPSRRSSNKDTLGSDRLEMFFSRMVNKEPEEAAVPKKTSQIPKFNHKAWGLSEDALVSWDQSAPSPTYELKAVEKDTAIYVQTCERGTSTEDMRGSQSSIFSANTEVVMGQKRVDAASPRKRLMLDKSCMAEEEELLLKLNMDEKEQMRKLAELFPHTPLELLLDLYAKCHKDFNWTVDLMTSCPPAILAVSPQKNATGTDESLSALAFDLNDWDINPASPSTDTQTAEVDAAEQNRRAKENEVKEQLRMLKGELAQIKKEQQDLLEEQPQKQQETAEPNQQEEAPPKQQEVAAPKQQEWWEQIQNNPELAQYLSATEYELIKKCADSQQMKRREEELERLREKEESEKLKKEEELARLKREEELERVRKQEELERLKKEEELEKLRKQEEFEKLKKQLEKSVTIGKEHYSERIWQVKHGKGGIAQPPPLPLLQGVAGLGSQSSTSSGLLTLDENTVYVSDEDVTTSSSGEGSDTTSDEEMVELNLSADLVGQLQSMFGQLPLGSNLKPIVQVPESLARQLHGFYLESLCRQIENQSDHIFRQMKEDEEFASQLQEAERRSAHGNSMSEIMDEELALSLQRRDVEQWKNLSPETLAQKLTKKKLYETFPALNKSTLDELLVAHGNDYRETVRSVMSSTGVAQVAPSSSGEDILEPPVSDKTLKEMKTQVHTISQAQDESDGKAKSAMAYREQANAHVQKSQELQQLARMHYRERAFAVASFYNDLAKKELQNAELANQMAAQSFVRENSEKLNNTDTLDLHFQYADGALNTLDIFIDYQISYLKRIGQPYGWFYVITGWGKHSSNRRSVLKPLVMTRLTERNIRFKTVNLGMFKIKVLKNLLMTTDLEKKTSK